MDSVSCVIPTLEALAQNWDREIAQAVVAGDSLENWETWKVRSIDNFLRGRTILYFGLLDGRVITQAVAYIDPLSVQNSAGLVDGQTAYLSAFRTVEDHRGQGYFSELFRFLTADLRKRGYTAVTLGVEPEENSNLAIYTHYGFQEKIKSAVEIFPDGSAVSVDYYRKKL